MGDRQDRQAGRAQDMWGERARETEGEREREEKIRTGCAERNERRDSNQQNQALPPKIKDRVINNAK